MPALRPQTDLMSVAVAAAAMFWPPPVDAATPFSLTGSSYTQSFDGMVNSATSALPTGWALASGTSPTWTSGTLASTTQFAGTVGTGTLTATSSGGAYLFVNGIAATGSDKAVGFLSSSGFLSPRSILFGITNDTASTISSLDIGWTYEKYRNGTRAFDWKFYGSTDGVAWTSITGGNKSYSADASNSPIAILSSTIAPLRLSGLSVAAGSPYYLRWDYAGVGGSSNSQALGIDAFSLVVSGSTPPVYGTYWDPLPAAGIGGSGTWTATGATFATSPSGTAVGLLAASATPVFAGSPGAVTISGSVAAGGLTFAVDGYALSEGTVRLSASGTISVADDVSASIDSTLARDAGGSTSFDAGSAASLFVSGTITGGSGIIKTGPGDLILVGDNPFSGQTLVAGGWLRLGAGGTTGSVAGPISVAAADAMLVIDRSDDHSFAAVVSGSGGLAKEGGNTVTLTGSNSYTGGTTLFAGTLVVGDGGTAGSIAPQGPLDLSVGTAVVFDRSDDVAFSGTVAGGGAVVQRGDGRLVLSQSGPIGPSLTLRAEAGIIDLDRSGAPLTGMLDAGNTVELAGGTLELTASTGTGSRIAGAAIVVDGAGMLAICRTGSPGDHVTTGVDCPITVLGSGTLAFDYCGAFVGPTLPPVRYRGTTTFTGPVTIEADTTLAVTNSAGGFAEVVLAGTLAAAPDGSLTKTGDQTLTLASSGTLAGPTRVAAGTLRIASPGILSSSTVTVDSGAVLAVAPDTRATVRNLAVAASGLVDVASGGMRVASGLSATNLVSQLLAGRGDGSWNGTTGITSTAAAADVALGIPRTVGWLDNSGGSVSFAFAAPGDTNLDWQIDVLDAASIIAAGKFNTGSPAIWAEGDFNYDGIADVLDAVDFITTGLYDQGFYNPPPGAVGSAAGAAVATVPEPALPVAAVVIAWLVSARCWARIRRTSQIVFG